MGRAAPYLVEKLGPLRIVQRKGYLPSDLCLVQEAIKGPGICHLLVVMLLQPLSCVECGAEICW